MLPASRTGTSKPLVLRKCARESSSSGRRPVATTMPDEGAATLLPDAGASGAIADVEISLSCAGLTVIGG